MDEVKELKQKTINGMLWSFIDLFSGRGIQFLTTVILARLLLPEDFGLIAIALLLVAVSNALIDGGFSQALIREKELSNDDYSTVFYCNLLLAFIMYWLLFETAQHIALFFNLPALENMIKIFSLVIIINSFGLVQKVRLIRQINFKLQAIINLIAGVISGIVAVICAYTYIGAWSIIIQTMLMQLIQVSLFWICNRWKPLWRFNIRSIKRLFKFSFQMMISTLINTIYNNLFYIIIGKFYPTRQLGYYTTADKLNEMASISITTAIQRVSYPMLSAIQRDEQLLKNAFRKTLRAAAYITFPVMIGLAAISQPLITVLYGNKWLPMAGYFQLLCFIGMLYPLHAIYLNILQVKGKSNLFLRLEIIKKALMTVLIIVAVWMKLGITGLIGAAFLHSFICLFLNAFYPLKMLSYTIREHLKDIAPIFMGAFFMGMIVYASSFVLPDSVLIKLAMQVSIGIFSFIGLSKLLKIKELELFLSIILSLLPKKPFILRSKSKIRG